MFSYVAQLTADKDVEAALNALMTLGERLVPLPKSTLEPIFLRLGRFSNPNQAVQLLQLLAPLIPIDCHLSARLLALSFPEQLENTYPRANALAALAPVLRTNELFEEALTTVISLADDVAQAIVLVALAAVLPVPLLYRTQQIVADHMRHTAHAERVRVAVWSALVKLQEPLDLAVTLSGIADPAERVRLLALCVPHLAEPAAQSAIHQINTLAQQFILSDIKPAAKLKPDSYAFPESRMVLRDIASDVLVTIMPYCAPSLFDQAVNKLLARWDRMDDTWVFPALAKKLSPNQQSKLFMALLAFLHSPQGEWKRSAHRRNRILYELVPSIPDDQLAPALRVALANFSEICAHLGGFAKRIDPSLDTTPLTMGSGTITAARFQRSMGEQFDVNDMWDAMKPLAALVERAPDRLLADVLATIEPLQDTPVSIVALASLARYLPEPLFRHTLEMYYQLKQQNVDELSAGFTAELLGKLLIALVPRLDQPKASEFLLAELRSLDSRGVKKSYSEVLIAAVEFAPPDQRPALSRDALMLQRAIGDKEELVLARMALFKHLPFAYQATEIDALRAAIDRVYPALEKDSTGRRLAQSDREVLLSDLSQALARHGRAQEALECLAELEPADYITGIFKLQPYRDPSLDSFQLAIQTQQLAINPELVFSWLQQSSDQQGSLSQDTAQLMLRLVQHISDVNLRGATLAYLLPQAAGKAQQQLGDQLLHLLQQEPVLSLRTVSSIAALHDRLPAGVRHELRQTFRDDRCQLVIWGAWPFTNLQRHVIREIRQNDRSIPETDLGTLSPRLQQTLRAIRPELIPLPQYLQGTKDIGLIPLIEEQLHLPLTQIIAERVLRIEDDRQRSGALTCLLPILPRWQREQALDWIFDWLKAQSHTIQPLELAQIYLAVAPYSPRDDQRIVIREAILKCIRSYRELNHAYGVVTPCDVLTSSFAALDRTLLAEVWDEIMTLFNDVDRAAIFNAIWVAAPVISLLGGAEGSAELYGGIEQISRWWSG